MPRAVDIASRVPTSNCRSHDHHDLDRRFSSHTVLAQSSYSVEGRSEPAYSSPLEHDRWHFSWNGAMTPARAGPVDAAPLPPRRPTDLRIPPAVVSAGEAEANGDADDPLLKTPTLGAPPSPSLYRPDPDYVDPLVTLAPTPASLSALVYSRGEDGRQLRPSMQQVVTEPKLREVFTRAYLRAASSGDGDLLEWLLAKPSASPSLTAVPARPSPRVGALSTPRIGTIGSPPLPPPQRILKPGEAKKWIDLDAKDDDGSPAVVLAAAFGHTEAIRAIIDGCGRGCIDSKDACALSLAL